MPKPQSAESQFRHKARAALLEGRQYEARTEVNKRLLEEVKSEIESELSSGLFPLNKQEHHLLMQRRRLERFATEMLALEDARSRAVERYIRQEARRLQEEARRLLPKCGAPLRTGGTCTEPKPCAKHELAPGMHWCRSTLDSRPRESCRMQCPVAKEYCEYHARFPNLGAKAACYYVQCQANGTPLTEEGLLRWAYPDWDGEPLRIHDALLFCRNCAKQM